MPMTLKGKPGSLGVQEVRSKSAFRRNYSKSWSVGDKLSCMLPIGWYEDPDVAGGGMFYVVTASTWGHKVNNMKKFKAGGTFLPSLTAISDDKKPCRIILGEDGKPIENEDGTVETEYIEGDAAYQFSKVAPLFPAGEKRREYKRIMNKSYGSDGEEQRQSALRDLEDEYDLSKNQDAPRPIIGPLTLYAATEVLVTPMKDREYQTDLSEIFQYELNSSKTEKFQALINDPKYRPEDINQKWFEFHITYEGKSNDKAGRSAAGRAAVPVGVTEQDLMCNADPAAFAKITNLINQMPEDETYIKARNNSFIRKDEKKIIRAIQSYMQNNADTLEQLETEEDLEKLSYNAAALMRFKAFECFQEEKIIDLVKKGYETYLSKHPEKAANTEATTPVEDVVKDGEDKAPTLKEIQEKNIELSGDTSGDDEYAVDEP